MAADTPTKRFSAMQIGSPWRGVCVVPGANPNEARPAVMFLYSGFAAAPTIPSIGMFVAPSRPTVFRSPMHREPDFDVPAREPYFRVDPRNRRQ